MVVTEFKGLVADRRRLRLHLLMGSALLVFMTQQAVAQCTLGGNSTRLPTTGNTINTTLDSRQFNAGLSAAGSISAVQSLISVLNTSNTAFLTQTSGFIGAPANAAADQAGGGTWVRGVGGTFDTRTSGSYLTLPYNTFPTGTASASTGACQNKTYQDYAGVQFGADISRLNIDGANLHLGVTAGYTESSLRSPTGNGTLNGDIQIPFVGIYAAMTKGNFYVDGQARWDFYQGQLQDSSNAIFGQRLDARSLSLTGNVGYNFSIADNWFVEPSVGGVYSQVKVDPFRLSGTAVLAGAGLAPPVNVRINDFDSLLGRASIRAGKNIISDNYVIQPFVTASVFSEFAGAVRTSVLTSFDTVNFRFFGSDGRTANRGDLDAFEARTNARSNRIGVYGQFSAGIAAQILNSGWLGYIRGDYRTGDHVDGWGISGGLRYQFTPETAVVRALVSKDGGGASETVQVIKPVNWTGLSVGINGGSHWSQAAQKFTDLVGPPTSIGTSDTGRPHAAGIVVGGELGADYQFNNRIVVGVAGQGNWTNTRGGRACPERSGFFQNCELTSDTVSFATARGGYAFDRTLFYAKAGAVFIDQSDRFKDITGNRPTIGFAGSGIPLQLPVFKPLNSFVTGWTAGGGFEFALTSNWFAKAEYLHYETEQTRGRYVSTVGDVLSVNRSASGDLVTIGVKYRFGSEAPSVQQTVIAKY